MVEMTDVLAAALEVEDFCNSQNWNHCFIGGLAVQRWGNPRYTRDVDLTLLTGYGGEERFIDTFLKTFPPRIPDAAKSAILSRVVLAKTRRGIPVDMSLGAWPFEENCVSRSSLWKIGHASSLRTCSADDLIVLKVFAGRTQDWADVEVVLTRQMSKLDIPQIKADVRPLLEIIENTESLSKFDKLVDTVRRRLKS